MSSPHQNEQLPSRANATLFKNKREMLLARLLLRIADTLAASDRDQEFIELYNSVKSFAEPRIRRVE